VHYEHLKVGAGVLVQHHGKLLLVQRSADCEAFPSTWGIPAGYCEVAEQPAEAAQREAAEETGLSVRVRRLADVLFFDDDPRGNGLLIVYEADLDGEADISLEHRPGGEIAAVAFFAPDSLPEELCGVGHTQVIRGWQVRALDRWQPGTGMRYCPHCAHPLEEQEVFDRVRPTCRACGFVHFQGPKVGVSLLVEDGGRLLLVRRAVEPGMGRWCLPSGFVEADEPPAEAAARECEEETGLRVSGLRLVEVVRYTEDFRGPGINIVYRATRASGALQAGDDADAARFFAPNALPPMAEIAFAGHRRSIRAWKLDVLSRGSVE
jgi:ADP-ribose pyrophosphatase YjhB (NUDIX family)